MALKAKKVDSKKRIEELNSELASNYKQIEQLLQINKEIKEEILEVQIAPFKLGGYAMCEVTLGKSAKLQKCLLECSEHGYLQVRPVKEDGTLSGRHFIKVPNSDNNYSHVLQEVKE